MEEIIKSIINIDKSAIQKEEDCKLLIENMEAKKQAKALAIKTQCESTINEEVAAYRNKVSAEVQKETDRIKMESEQQKAILKERFAKFEESVAEDAYKMILRNLEE